MELILDTQPYMLYETIAMLTKYVNRISMLDIRDTLLRLYRSGLDETWRRRLECLQEILEQVCADVDREDPDMQYFFSKRELSGPSDLTNLARVLTHPFIEWRSPKLEEEAEALKEDWRCLQARGFRLAPDTCGISFIPLPAGEAQESFFRQLYRLHLPGDLSMEVLNLYEDYTGNLDRLVGLITPYARRLEEQLAERPWLMESLGTYWEEQFQTISRSPFAPVPKWATGLPRSTLTAGSAFLSWPARSSSSKPRTLFCTRAAASMSSAAPSQPFAPSRCLAMTQSTSPQPSALWATKAGWSFFCAWPRTGATVSSWRWRPSATPATCPAASPPCPSAVC
ncbi:MAG: hypothetical protein ACLSHU_02695 [Oscillospiraceae bacterium]